jgi:hypothetical protein
MGVFHIINTDTIKEALEFVNKRMQKEQSDSQNSQLLLIDNMNTPISIMYVEDKLDDKVAS